MSDSSTPAPPPPPPTQPMGGAPGPTPSGQRSVGFFGALFDFSFNHFVTPMIVKVVYILATVLLILGWIVVVISAFTDSFGAGLAAIVLGALAFIVYLALVRITLEFYMAVVRMSEDIHQRLPRS